ncbi:MAG: hypothetical protein GY715_22440 [Planctomycetes bacterium]|nr:hypothetical protein [Planctomycetota bacterium]
MFRRDLVVLLVLAAFAAFMAFGVGGTPTAAQPPGQPQATPRPQPPAPTERIDVELGVDFPNDI